MDDGPDQRFLRSARMMPGCLTACLRAQHIKTGRTKQPFRRSGYVHTTHTAAAPTIVLKIVLQNISRLLYVCKTELRQLHSPRMLRGLFLTGIV